MANHDFLVPYSSEFETWLRNEGCDVPISQPGSRYPDKREVLDAIQRQGLGSIDKGESIYVTAPADAPSEVTQLTRTVKFISFTEGRAVESPDRPPLSYLVLIRCISWEKLNVDEKTSITMRGNFPLELFLVHELTRNCGQLVLYPDTGETPVVLEPGSDVGRLAEVWLEVVGEQAFWPEFYRRISFP